MKQISYWLLALSSLLIISCVDTEERDDTATGNFEALWTILDEHYCFFDYKQKEYGLDWNDVYAKYKVRINNNMSTVQLFEVLCDMLGELRDGHVNLSSSMDYGRYWKWQENYPYNYSDSLIRRYLGTDYKIASGLRYRVLDDNIGYIRCASFESPIGEGNLDEALSYLLLCRGLIIDIRGNGGGDLTTAERLAARFVEEKTLVGYMQHKTGKGHNDFSEMKEEGNLSGAVEQRPLAQEGVCADQPQRLQCCQRLCGMDALSAKCHPCWRPHRWRQRYAHEQQSAQRMERPLLSMSDVRPEQTADRIWHKPRRES